MQSIRAGTKGQQVSPRTIRIHTENNHFQHAEVLRRNRHKRQRYGEFFVEGVRSINLAVQHGWRITSFYFSTEHGLSDWAKLTLHDSQAETHVDLPAALLAKLSAKTDTSELLALVAMPPDDLARIPIRERLLVVAVDRPASPGNLGTLIRSCDALGVDGVIITGHAADLYDPETIRASTGSLFALPVVRLPAQSDLLSWIEQAAARIGPIEIVGTDEEAEREVWSHDFTRPTILAVGNETWGLSAAYRELCTAMVRIPIGGSASSLNVACAASIVLYEVERQRDLARE
jgi:tRNA G18 (ribose-2'-O)-methylase SpoU